MAGNPVLEAYRASDLGTSARTIASLFGYLGADGGGLVTPPESAQFHPTPIARLADLFAAVNPTAGRNPFIVDRVHDIGGAVDPSLGPGHLAGQGRAIGAPSTAVPRSRLYTDPTDRTADAERPVARAQAIKRERRRRLRRHS